MDIGVLSYPRYKLVDGTCVDWQINGSTFGFTVDTNGNKKGPNAYGHDIFGFWIAKNVNKLVPIKTTKVYTEEDLEKYRKVHNVVDYVLASEDGATTSAVYAQMGYPCSKDDPRLGNGVGCSWYALNDISPDDSTKGYWESLP